MKRSRCLILITSFILVIFLIAGYIKNTGSVQLSSKESSSIEFNGQRAFKDLEYQVSLGPRIPGTEPHLTTIDWITENLIESGWEVERQNSQLLNQDITNIVAKSQSELTDNQPLILLGAHYDTRIFADKDPNPEKRILPVPGANDGASGVALLLEIARVFPKDIPIELWLVFFDAEDNGGVLGWDWILGSRNFVDNLQEMPTYIVVVDMVADADLNIFYEKNSDVELSNEIWGYAAELGYSNYFISEPKYRILDDHIPFVEKGVKAVDIIDFDYPYWHTTLDTEDKVSPTSLQIVGDVILFWLVQHVNAP